MKNFELANNQSWAILPDMLSSLLKISIRKTDFNAGVAQRTRPIEKIYPATLQDDVAILPVTGPILRYDNFFSELHGATSIEQLTADFNTAILNPDIKAIVLEIDSPGGTVAGVNELAERIYAARGQKPIIAYVSGLGASAAYWLASAADEIVLDATASVGSIGVISVQTDDTELKNKAGLKDYTFVSSTSPRKRLDLNSESGRQDIQTHVDKIADVFVAAVARYRNVSADTVLADFGQGALLVGADAVKMGLADRLGSLEQVITELKNRTQSLLPRGTLMITSQNESIPVTAEWLHTHHPQIAAQLRQEGAKQERERIKSVEAQTIPGHKALIRKLKFDGKTTGPEAALQILAAEKATRSKQLAALKADAPQALPALHPQASDDVAAATRTSDDDLPDDEKYTAQWRKDTSLRAEFGSLESYSAYMKATTNGQVRILQHR